MPRGTMIRPTMSVQTFVATLANRGVVCSTGVNGEPLFELYSLLECLAPAPDDLAERLRQVQFVPICLAEMGLYLLYVPLLDVVEHLLPASTLPEMQALQDGCTVAPLSRQHTRADNGAAHG
jgi:hypothetical protein